MGLKEEIQQAYIVHGQILSLDNKPLLKKDNNIINSNWTSFFCDSKCFSKNEQSSIWIGKNPYPNKPFIPSLGSVWFNPKTNAGITYGKVPYDYLDLLYPESCEQEQTSKFSAFGINPDIEDQRMYYLCWSLCNSININLDNTDNINGTGEIFINIYPSGYIFIYFAINLDWSQSTNSLNLLDIIEETKPWILTNQWLWNTKLTNSKMKLCDILDFCQDKLRQSLFLPRKGMNFVTDNKYWFSSIKIFDDSVKEKIATAFNLTTYQNLDVDIQKNQIVNSIICSKNIMISTFFNRSHRENAINKFWKVLSLVSFVHYKKKIYKDFCTNLQDKTDSLKNDKLSKLGKKITLDKLRTFYIYDSELMKFIKILDNYTEQNIELIYQENYFSLVELMDLKQERIHVDNSIKNYEEQAKEWEPLVADLYKALWTPLTTLLPKTK